MIGGFPKIWGVPSKGDIRLNRVSIGTYWVKGFPKLGVLFGRSLE